MVFIFWLVEEMSVSLFYSCKHSSNYNSDFIFGSEFAKKIHLNDNFDRISPVNLRSLGMESDISRSYRVDLEALVPKH